MIEFRGKGILLDIEGTTSSISFVYDVMFPFVRRELRNYLDKHWGKEALQDACELIAQDTGATSFDAWRQAHNGSQQPKDETKPQDLVQTEIERLMDADIKATGLKQLQGLIWRAGFESGEMQAHLYDDVAPAIESWREFGHRVRIYSSGSIGAQKLFFGHTIAGDLLSSFEGHYDTTTGPKRETESYERIAADWELPAQEILFLSDVPQELDAARAAGFQTGLVIRPGNAEFDGACTHPTLKSFAEIKFT